MIDRTLDTGIRAAWVAADEVYGGNPQLRGALEERQVGYVLAVACDHQIATRSGKARAMHWPRSCRERAWQKLSAGGAGAKGHCCYSASPMPLATLVRVAGRRWTVEETFKAATTAHEHDHRPAPGELIPLTCNAIQYLFAAPTITDHPAAHHLGWSAWRRRQQARSRACHYEQQAAQQR